MSLPMLIQDVLNFTQMNPASDNFSICLFICVAEYVDIISFSFFSFSVCADPTTEFECHDKKFCVDKGFVCDGVSDCKDGSDEAVCKLYLSNI